MTLVPTTKIISLVKEGSRKMPFLVSFKAEHHPSLESIKSYFEQYHERYGVDLMVANDISEPGYGFASETNHVWILDGTNIQEMTSSKKEIAGAIFDKIEKLSLEN
jgi:phosphopantothenoylcysteine decarboxylase/phosphopantothenate--cysteine ligase